ncbi:MAG: DUF1016 N-terminal domain-containing protein [Waddliaceae bacterium]
MTTKNTLQKSQSTAPATVPEELLHDLRTMIEQAQKNIATAVNMSLTLLNWKIGKRIKNEILQGERAEYGQQIVVSLSRQLTREHSFIKT